MARKRPDRKNISSGKPWGGRFREKTARVVEEFTESISFDQRLWKYDIQGSIAHAKMLGKQGIISNKDAANIIKGLDGISRDIEAGKFSFREDLEDIHMNIEASLIERIGRVGGKLHTARSRNDQVALDLRLYLRAECSELDSLLRDFQLVLADVAEEYINLIMPGYTHMQRAQPVLLAQHLLAYSEMFERDRQRLSDVLKRINIMPLGAGALAGTSLPVDRKYVASLLGFRAVAQNSMDAVSDRDFALEFVFVSSMIMVHMSRMAEELVLWAGSEFSFVELPDAFATGSSIMPQKKNPDVPELVRGKTGRVCGDLMALLTMVKGLPLTYNRDLQEDKLPVFNAADTTKASLLVMSEMFRHIKFNATHMYEAASMDYSTATDVAEYLVKKGMPFREAHGVTGKLVAYCIENNLQLQELKLENFNQFSKLFGPEVIGCVNVKSSVASRRSEGGTAASQVKRQLKKLRSRIAG